MFWYFDYDEPVYRPPSEAQSLILQITLGCSQNRCTFCGMYKTKHFTVRPVEEVLAQVAAFIGLSFLSIQVYRTRFRVPKLPRSEASALRRMAAGRE